MKLLDKLLIDLEVFQKKKTFYKEINIQRDKIVTAFEFNKINYPLLNDVDFRNFIEHINEKDCKLIEKQNYYGMFNLIYPGMDIKTKNNLESKSKIQNNIYNFIDKTYSIAFINNEHLKQKKIDLIELKNEISKIYEISNKIWDYLSNPTF